MTLQVDHLYNLSWDYFDFSGVSDPGMKAEDSIAIRIPAGLNFSPQLRSRIPWSFIFRMVTNLQEHYSLNLPHEKGAVITEQLSSFLLSYGEHNKSLQVASLNWSHQKPPQLFLPFITTSQVHWEASNI